MPFMVTELGAFPFHAVPLTLIKYSVFPFIFTLASAIEIFSNPLLDLILCSKCERIASTSRGVPFTADRGAALTLGTPVSKLSPSLAPLFGFSGFALLGLSAGFGALGRFGGESGLSLLVGRSGFGVSRCGLSGFLLLSGLCRLSGCPPAWCLLPEAPLQFASLVLVFQAA